MQIQNKGKNTEKSVKNTNNTILRNKSNKNKKAQSKEKIIGADDSKGLTKGLFGISSFIRSGGKMTD